MPAFKSRSRSLDYTLNNSKKNWLSFIFSGFGASQKHRKREKSEKSAYSQTEIYNIICHNETGTQCSNNFSKSSHNLSSENSKSLISTSDVKEYENTNKVYHKYNHILRRIRRGVWNCNQIDGSLEEFIESIIAEYCCSIIKYETINIQNSVILQQMKFKHDLSKLYRRIYTCDNINKNGNIYCPKIVNDNIVVNDILHRALRSKGHNPEYKPVLSHDQENKKVYCSSRPFIPKRYTIKKCPKEEKIILKNENRREVPSISEKLAALEMHNDQVDGDDLQTITCAVSVSSSSIHSNQASISGQSQTKQSKKERVADRNYSIHKDDCYINVVSFNSKMDSVDTMKQNIESETYHKHKKDKNNDNRQLKEMRANSVKSHSNFAENGGQSRQVESSVVLDFEVLPCAGDNQRISTTSDHTFSDVRTFSTLDEFSHFKGGFFKSPALISVAWSNAQNMISNTGDEANLITHNIEYSKRTNAGFKQETTRPDLDVGNAVLERNWETERSVSTKYSHLPDHCVTLSESISHRYGTLCEVLSDDCSINSDMSYHPPNSVYSPRGVAFRMKTNSTFRKHTISSKLKMRNDS